MTALRRALLLVGSPKGRQSTSASLGGYLLEQLAQKGLQTERIYIHQALRSEERQRALLDAVDGTDLLILAFPLYVDSLPAPAIAALELIAGWRRASPAADKPLFLAIANSGFPETRQNDTALAVCRRFAAETGMDWAGGLALGGGGAINGRPLGEAGGMARHVVKALDLAAAALAEGQAVPEEAVRLMARRLVPIWLYILLGNYGWKQQARKNGVAGKLKARPYR